MKTLAHHRAEKMLTVRALAAVANVSPTTLTKIEHGRVRPHFGTMLAVAGALGLVDVREVAEFDTALDSKIREAA